MKLIKKYGVIIVMLAVEGYFFYSESLKEGVNYELFFFGWAALWFAIFFLSRNDSSGSGIGIDFSKSRNLNNFISTNGKSYDTNTVKSEKDRASIISLEFMYLFMFVANVIAYIIYVNIVY